MTENRSISRRVAAAVGTAVVVALAVAGCTSSNDSLSSQYGSGSTQNYISGDGAVTEVTADKRGDAVDFSVTATDGTKLSSDALKGKVVVLNFWYAGCPPCRAEAKYFRTAERKYASSGVQFIGVNVRDEAGTAAAFERNFKIDYPTVLDAKSGTMQLALSGKIAPNSVPTTIVLDTKGRVAARVLGAIDGPGILNTLVDDELGKA